MAQDDPVIALIGITRRLSGPLETLLAQTDPAEFDRIFTENESDILAWKVAYDRIDKTNDKQVATAIKIATMMLPYFGRVHQKSVEIGATKGQKLATAPAAGGRWKMPRKMSRKYCKKTPCRKMGFTQRSSCRPYKNCFTRKRGRSA